MTYGTQSMLGWDVHGILRQTFPHDDHRLLNSVLHRVSHPSVDGRTASPAAARGRVKYRRRIKLK